MCFLRGRNQIVYFVEIHVELQGRAVAQLVTVLPLLRPLFDSLPVPFRSAIEKVALGQFSLRVFRFSLVTPIPPLSHSYLHRNNAIGRRTSGLDL